MTTENLLKQRLTWKENHMKSNLAHSADNSQKPKATGYKKPQQYETVQSGLHTRIECHRGLI